MKRWFAFLGILILFLSMTAFGPAPAALAQAHTPVSALVSVLEVGRPVSHQGLTIIPVYTRRVFNKTDYATFEEALKNKWIEVSEVEGGRVPQVKISNLSKNVLFLMGGRDPDRRPAGPHPRPGCPAGPGDEEPARPRVLRRAGSVGPHQP